MNKKGFTLVELLAVIAILAILVVIALPNVLSMFNSAKKDIFLTEAKNVYKEVSKKYISETMKGNKITKISSDGIKLDLESSNLEYDIRLDNEGNIKDFQVSDGTYCISGKFNNLSELTSEKITEGKCNKIEEENVTYCTYDGELSDGVTYVNGGYTYRYNAEEVLLFDGSTTISTNNTDSWSVTLTDKNSTSDVNSKLCTYINNKPITSMSLMFYGSKATKIDLSSFNTSNVKNMSGMFYKSNVLELDLSSFDTSNVTNMGNMFNGTSNLTKIYIKTFNTNSVLSSENMFKDSTKIVGGSGTIYNSSYIDKTYARIDGGVSNPGYFTSK